MLVNLLILSPQMLGNTWDISRGDWCFLSPSTKAPRHHFLHYRNMYLISIPVAVLISTWHLNQQNFILCLPVSWSLWPFCPSTRMDQWTFFWGQECTVSSCTYTQPTKKTTSTHFLLVYVKIKIIWLVTLKFCCPIHLVIERCAGMPPSLSLDAPFHSHDFFLHVPQV